MHGHGVLDQRDQGGLGRGAVTRVALDHPHVRADRQCLPDVGRLTGKLPSNPLTATTGVIGASAAAAPATASELAKSTEYPFKQVKIGPALRMIQLMNPHQPLDRHISDQDPHYA